MILLLSQDDLETIFIDMEVQNFINVSAKLIVPLRKIAYA